MQQLSQVLGDIRSNAKPWERSKDTSNMPRHGLPIEVGKMNTQLSQSLPSQSSQRQMTTGQPGLSSAFLDLLNDRNIDWNGNCEFENGEVIGFKKADSRNHFQMRPIPQGEKATQAAKEAMITLNAIMQPASRDQIAIAIKKLSLHCGKQNKSANDIAVMLADYYHDLRNYPIKLIEEACEKYRLLPEGNEFMPNSGKLITFMTEKYAKMQFLRVRINKILGLHIEQKPRENRSLSLDEALANLITN